ncbi:Uncharacterised protein [Bordetella pertussis]|nr:Uncharacterised protein [Bordetella pertussis]
MMENGAPTARSWSHSLWPYAAAIASSYARSPEKLTR